jgi:hypothetical protein
VTSNSTKAQSLSMTKPMRRFFAGGSDSSALRSRSAGSSYFAPYGLGRKIPFILERLHLALELILESLFARQLELVSTREDLPALIV